MADINNRQLDTAGFTPKGRYARGAGVGAIITDGLSQKFPLFQTFQAATQQAGPYIAIDMQPSFVIPFYYRIGNVTGFA
jgi:hypothetical protein